MQTRHRKPIVTKFLFHLLWDLWLPTGFCFWSEEYLLLWSMYILIMWHCNKYLWQLIKLICTHKLETSWPNFLEYILCWKNCQFEKYFRIYVFIHELKDPFTAHEHFYLTPSRLMNYFSENNLTPSQLMNIFSETNSIPWTIDLR